MQLPEPAHLETRTVKRSSFERYFFVVDDDDVVVDVVPLSWAWSRDFQTFDQQ